MSEGRGHAGDPPASREDESLESLRVRVARALEPDFQLLRVLGSGEAAHVFLAREPALQRLVAVKVLRPEAGARETVAARFEREAHLAAGIKHPGVPAVHRIGRLEDGVPFAIQEYVEGRTLRDRLETMGAVPPSEAKEILADLAFALVAAHAAGVIHRDVRPENVILASESGRAILTDFGLAAVQETGAETGPKLTREGEILGDPRYASPEQLRGEPVTEQTDVYSLGVLGYEMLTLSNPFGSRSRGQLVADHLEGAPRELPAELTHADPRTAEILVRCLVKDPVRRPRAQEVATALSESGAPDSGAARLHGAGAWSDSVLAPFPRVAAFVSELRRRRVYQV
ncbi:MAG: protein kinase, partial [Gemmatimonadetes bacterium]|nr:serine/threonine protein kinase [Gemmatimonadota bacterium]NIR79019.1 serine/threonine protein kinase [Gemmatimonadota bacterium]NIT87666.1 serine/threonine protein kinase [Gemmatimonadota bacterium]NIU31535.1 serine/threonine protein kinase [Gemmatimonadota bacterium]NIU36189.1 protein kinase [Gemmatimonadota bacterium]